MAADQKAEWTVIYETPSESDADLVRMTLEVAGYWVSMQPASSRDIFRPGSEITVAVPTEDADDARDYLRQKTSLLPHDPASVPSDAATSDPLEGLADAAQDILELRGRRGDGAGLCGRRVAPRPSSLTGDSDRLSLGRAGLRPAPAAGGGHGRP